MPPHHSLLEYAKTMTAFCDVSPEWESSFGRCIVDKFCLYADCGMLGLPSCADCCFLLTHVLLIRGPVILMQVLLDPD